MSTEIPGDFSNTSIAVAPTFEIEASTFTIILSIFCSINGFFAVTVTSPIAFDLGTNSIVFNATEEFVELISKVSENPLLCPIAEIETKYLPSGTASNSYLPVLSATLIFTTEESLALNNVIVADSMVLVFPSITVPLILPSFTCAWLTKEKAVKATVSMVKIFLIFFDVLFLVPVFDNYSPKLSTLFYQVHCFKLNGLFWG